MAHQPETLKVSWNRTSARTLTTLAVAAVLLAGCSGAGFRTHAQVLSENAESYIAAHPELADATKNDIRRHKLRKGMSRQEVIAAWGRPVLVRNFTSGGSEYWYFGCDWPHSCSYPDEQDGYPLIDEVYESQAAFKDGRLISWRG